MDSAHFDKPRPTPFAQWLTQWRIAKRYRQSDLAGELGIHSGRISELETGQRKPTAELARRIHDCLGVDVPPPQVG
ncbi:MAG: helix-turn-helix domain-containing protein [Actinomycetota bacterium]